jgi:small-conductance mechanosensitive channel
MPPVGVRLRACTPRAIAPAGVVVCWCVLVASVFAQGGTAGQPARESGVPVMYPGQEVVRIYSRIGAIGPIERARLTSQRLNRFVRDLDLDPTQVTVNDRETYSELVFDDRVLGIITDDDAKAVGQPRPEFARQVRNRLVDVVITTRHEFSTASILIGLVWAALATVLVALLLRLLARVRRRFRYRVEVWLNRLTAPTAEGEAPRRTRIGSLVHGAVVVATGSVAVALLAMWVEVVLQVLPWSRPLARRIYGYASAPIGALWLGFQGFVPNLFYLVTIALTTFLVLRVVRVVFREIEVGNIRFASFPDDWAEPTYKLVRALLIAMALVGAFPYIPGSQSPAFQAISIFVGLLVSFSSGSTFSNIIAGTVLTYTRAFRLGDFVRIGETFGEVTVKRLLVTHVRTTKNVVVSIPNSVILTTHVLNYSTLAREGGLIAHTPVTIGYDAPWRKVHELLVAAASRTEGVLQDPSPFVEQTALNDVSVTYVLNAFVVSPHLLPRIYSALHTNIQDCFNEAGVEILSPNYYALRHGNQATIPKEPLPSDHAPALRVHDQQRAIRDVTDPADATMDTLDLRKKVR